MRKLKKVIVSIVMVSLLAVTAVPSTSIEVQAASVGKSNQVKSSLHKRKSKSYLEKEHPELKNMKFIDRPTEKNTKR